MVIYETSGNHHMTTKAKAVHQSHCDCSDLDRLVQVEKKILSGCVGDPRIVDVGQQPTTWSYGFFIPAAKLVLLPHEVNVTFHDRSQSSQKLLGEGYQIDLVFLPQPNTSFESKMVKSSTLCDLASDYVIDIGSQIQNDVLVWFYGNGGDTL